MSNRAQLNARIPGGLKSRVSREKFQAQTTNDIIVEVALENLFTKFSPQQRASFYKTQRKPYARTAAKV